MEEPRNDQSPQTEGTQQDGDNDGSGVVQPVEQPSQDGSPDSGLQTEQPDQPVPPAQPVPPQSPSEPQQ